MYALNTLQKVKKKKKNSDRAVLHMFIPWLKNVIKQNCSRKKNDQGGKTFLIGWEYGSISTYVYQLQCLWDCWEPDRKMGKLCPFNLKI